MILGLVWSLLAMPAPADNATAAAAAFTDFKVRFSRAYASPAEEAARFSVFQQTLREIRDINSRPGQTWEAGMNEFADMTWDEFRSTVLMAPQNCSATHRGGGHVKGLTAPPYIDWRDFGALNAVKNQRACGSCWTFSTTGCLESHVFLKTGNMPNISEQQLVDCAGGFNNKGCNGGLPSQAYEYIHYNGGIDSEKAYPYAAKDGNCTFKPAQAVAKVQAVVNITAFDEDELLDAVGSVGPVSIAFDVSKDFRLYKAGVYNGDCETDPQHVNHAVVAVGYGRSAPVGEYWIVRNSWGTGWGVNGYFNIKRGVNKCGLADCASYPIV